MYSSDFHKQFVNPWYDLRKTEGVQILDLDGNDRIYLRMSYPLPFKFNNSKILLGVCLKR